MIYTVTLNPAIDYVVDVKDFQTGKLNRADRESIQIGGKGINVSRVLARLGVETTAMGFVAGFTGREIERFLMSEKIKTDFVSLRDGFSRINVKLKGVCETEINGRGPHVCKEEINLLEEKLDLLQQGDFLVLAGSVPPSLPTDFYEKILARLRPRGVEFVVDAEGELLTRALPFHPFLIKPNEAELAGIFHEEKLAADQIESCARKLQQQGARNVLVSLGGKGAALLDETGAFCQTKAPQGTVRNSVGAGDSMVAGFLAGCLEQRGYVWALRVGIAAGSATAFSDDLAQRREIEELLKEGRYEKGAG